MSASPELDILTRAVAPEDGQMSAELAAHVLAMGFRAHDIARMNDLAARARAGTLTDAERSEADWYDVVGNLVAILHSKARLALRDRACRTQEADGRSHA